MNIENTETLETLEIPLFSLIKEMENLINGVLIYNFNGDNDKSKKAKKNNRSSKRTDIYHKLFAEMLLNSNNIKYTIVDKIYYTKTGKISKAKSNQKSFHIEFGAYNEYRLEFEKDIMDFHDKTFTLDAILYKNDKIKIVYLFKFEQSSICKNLNNGENTTGGEILRITGGETYLNTENNFKIVFITIMPDKTLQIDTKNRANSTIEYPYEKFTNDYKDFKEHPLLKDIDTYEFKIGFTPNENYENALILDEPNDFTNYVKNIHDFDIMKIPVF